MHRIASRALCITLAWTLFAVVPAQALASAGSPQASDERTSPGLRQAISAAMERDAHRIHPAGEHDGFATYEATNRANGLRFMFDEAGIQDGPCPGAVSCLADRVRSRCF